MKHLLIIALLLSSTQGNAQTWKTDSSVMSQTLPWPSDSTPISSTLPYTDSNAVFAKGIDTASYIVGSYSFPATHDYKMVYRDTVVQDPSSEYYPGRMINSFNYSHSTSGHKVDTIFIYDHYQWLLQRVREEQEYWDAICKKNSFEHNAGLDAKIQSLMVTIPAAKNREYYSGMEDMLTDILNDRGRSKWNFKSKDKSKRRTK